jgi:hypothetical protein
VHAYFDAGTAGSWEIHVPLLTAADPAARPAADFARADATGYYHGVPAAEVPAPVLERGASIVGSLVAGGVGLAALDERSASLVEALRAVVAASDLGDEEAMERAVADARALVAPYHPHLAEAPEPAPSHRP